MGTVSHLLPYPLDQWLTETDAAVAATLVFRKALACDRDAIALTRHVLGVSSPDLAWADAGVERVPGEDRNVIYYVYIPKLVGGPLHADGCRAARIAASGAGSTLPTHANLTPQSETVQ